MVAVNRIQGFQRVTVPIQSTALIRPK